MKNIKQHFNDFRSNTPKHIQWLLLGAAFVIVIILLTLILTYRSTNKDDETNSNQPVVFKFEPKNIDFSDTEVGKTGQKLISVKINIPVTITSVEFPDSKELTAREDCISDSISECNINVIYKPTKAQDKSDTELQIKWHFKDQEDYVQTQTFPVSFSAKVAKIVEPDPEPEPEPVVEPEPEPQPEPIEDDDEKTDEPAENEPVDEIRDFAEPNPFREPEPEPEPILAAEKCSEFAIPGYDAAGHQIGWIKPEHGANYFHPFSDKDCSNPTGKYDFATGVITSLEDGSKIGTDSDHIGYRNVRTRSLKLPQLSSVTPSSQSNVARMVGGRWENAIWQPTDVDGNPLTLSPTTEPSRFDRNKRKTYQTAALLGSAATEEGGEAVVSSIQYDRTFILRQFKPIPATIVSEVRADPSVYGCNKGGECPEDADNYSIPVRATVDRNVYSDDGRTIILPTGTLLMGYLSGDLPGPYQAFGRMNIKWYQFIRPDGVEFNFGEGQDPYSADAQGRMGVPGHGSTDYIEQMVMPLLTAMVPAAVNMIAPITDTVINQIDLDNNTVVQSGTIRSSEMAKQDIINTWNKITQKLLVDAIDNTVPPFSIAAGTRINVFSPVDLIVTCGAPEGNTENTTTGKKCAFVQPGTNKRRKWSKLKEEARFVGKDDSSWVGQIRSFDLNKYCQFDDSKNRVTIGSDWAESGYDYRTVLAYCESQNFVAINNAKNAAYSASVQKQADKKKEEYGITQTWDDTTGKWTTNFTDDAAEQKYNEEVLGLTYDDEGNIINPFSKPANAVVEESLTCEDGSSPDANGCCTGETYTNMGDSYVDDSGSHFACCPDSDPGGDCFPPITVE